MEREGILLRHHPVQDSHQTSLKIFAMEQPSPIVANDVALLCARRLPANEMLYMRVQFVAGGDQPRAAGWQLVVESKKREEKKNHVI